MGDISNGTRILLTQYLLKRLTDEDHALSRDNLISRIGGLGTTISSNTIKADIESIKSYNDLIKDCQKELLMPFKCSESGSIIYATKQKKGAYIEQTYYSDAQLILLTRLLGKGLYLKDQGNSNLLEKVLSDSSLYKINHYHLLDNISEENTQNDILTYLEKIIKAINNFACVSFKRLEYRVIDNEVVDVAGHKTILLYPTNIDVKDEQVYVVGYHINSGEDFELAYYRLDRLTRLKMVRTPKHAQSKVENFKERIWISNDPLDIGKDNLINLQLRVYVGNENIFEQLYQRFKNNPILVEQFRQFIDVSIEQVVNDEDLAKWFLQQANHIEIFKPIELREKIKEEISQMYIMYRN